MSPFDHRCRPLCDVCLAEQHAQLGGVAQNRGHAWAVAIAEVIPIDRPWPFTERSRAIARRTVSDLTRDERLLELLADECVTGAARW